MNPNGRVEIEIFCCGRCGGAVETKWAYSTTKEGVCLGLLADQKYAFVADVIFHSECWDKLVKEHPP